jgi:hypothetical protein
MDYLSFVMCPLLVPHLTRHFGFFLAVANNSTKETKEGRRYVPLISLSYLDVYETEARLFNRNQHFCFSQNSATKFSLIDTLHYNAAHSAVCCYAECRVLLIVVLTVVVPSNH